MNNAIWLSGEPVSVVDLPYWPNNSCFFSGVKYIVLNVLWHVSTLLPEEYAPGSTPRQIVLTLDPAGAWRKDRYFFPIYKIFFQRKRIYRPITFSINFDRLAKQVPQGVAKFRKYSLKVGCWGVCCWAENSGNMVFILNKNNDSVTIK